MLQYLDFTVFMENKRVVSTHTSVKYNHRELENCSQNKTHINIHLNINNINLQIIIRLIQCYYECDRNYIAGLRRFCKKMGL